MDDDEQFMNEVNNEGFKRRSRIDKSLNDILYEPNQNTDGNKKPNVIKLENENDIDGLIEALNYPDVYIRRNSIKVLARIKDKKAIPALTYALNRDSDILVKKYAKRALDKLKINCPQCEFSNNTDATYCQDCGFDLRAIEENNNTNLNKIEEIDTKCPICGYENKEDAKFCAGCGNKIDSIVQNTNNPNIIDINNDSEDKIASLPGIGPILAKKVVQIRGSKGEFDSVEDFCSLLELKPHIAKNIQSLIICKSVTKNQKQGPSRRVVDF